MLKDIDRYDDIDRYVTDKMTPAEREAFIKEVEEDASLKAHLHLVDDIKNSLARRNEKLERMEKWQQELARERSTRRNIFRISSIAVAAVVLLGVFFSIHVFDIPSSEDSIYMMEANEILRSPEERVNILSYWESENYDECLTAIYESIVYYTDLIENLDSSTMHAGEFVGKYELYTSTIDYLKWANIQTLIRMDKKLDALIEVEKYLSLEGHNREAALKLKKKLMNELK